MTIIENVLSALNEGTARIRFTKTDGSVRELFGTRNPNLIPTEFQPKDSESSTRKVNESVVTVFDLESNGWRSFKKDSLLDFEVA
jgi:hypothetical protein